MYVTKNIHLCKYCTHITTSCHTVFLCCSIIIPVIECTTRKIIHITFYCCLIQSDQKVSVRLMITVRSSGAQRLLDHSVYKIIVHLVTLHIQSLIIISFLSKLENEVGQMLADSRQTSYWKMLEYIYLFLKTWITVPLILELSILHIFHISVHCLLHQLHAALINTHIKCSRNVCIN